MGLLHNQKFNVVETDDPLTILNMDLEAVEKFALYNRPFSADEVSQVHETMKSRFGY